VAKAATHLSLLNALDPEPLRGYRSAENPVLLIILPTTLKLGRPEAE
jgi:hypothetical protein